MSPTLGCYGDTFARTPALDAFARQSVRYTHAFATAPVCSPSRSCLITGMYATSLGTHNLRSQFPVPPEVKGFPKYLRDRGYFTSNNVKTDYNLANEPEFIRATWDESSAEAHWRHRKPGQPFFSVFNLMITHQSRTGVWSWEEFEKEVQPHLSANERSDPDKVPLPPYYPDTPVVRRGMARYYDCVAAMDKIVAGLLKELEDAGLSEDTVVFFYSDHGSGMPRHKRCLQDSGMRVPLMVRVPKKWQHLTRTRPGEVSTQLVSFVDFPPTVLSLAGVDIPDYMQGVAFLGPKAGKPRTHIYGARDRVDEAFDLARSVRDNRWLYIRNYMPHLPWHQPEGYSDNAELRREITRLAAEGKLNAPQTMYAGKDRPREELYDTQKDPFQIHNLAGDPSHKRRLEQMRHLHRDWVLETRDMGFLPESELAARSQGMPPVVMAEDAGKYPLERLGPAAELVGDAKAVESQIGFMSSTDAGIRYWGVVGLRAQRELPGAAFAALKQAVGDPVPAVRIEAAGALLERGPYGPALDVLAGALISDDWIISVHAARMLELLGEAARPLEAQMRGRLRFAESKLKEADAALYVQFSLQAALTKLGAAK